MCACDASTPPMPRRSSTVDVRRRTRISNTNITAEENNDQTRDLRLRDDGWWVGRQTDTQTDRQTVR